MTITTLLEIQGPNGMLHDTQLFQRRRYLRRSDIPQAQHRLANRQCAGGGGGGAVDTKTTAKRVTCEASPGCSTSTQRRRSRGSRLRIFRPPRRRRIAIATKSIMPPERAVSRYRV
jgi:hypothetical protein